MKELYIKYSSWMAKNKPDSIVMDFNEFMNWAVSRRIISGEGNELYESIFHCTEYDIKNIVKEINILQKENNKLKSRINNSILSFLFR